MEREIQVEITNECPNDCLHCSSFDLRMLPHPNPVNCQKLESFVRRVPGKKIVILTGGEPLCSESLIDICTSLHKIPDTRIGLFTCGIPKKDGVLDYVDSSYAMELFTRGVSECYVSLYGNNAEIHNKITNADTFSLTCKSIKSFVGAGIRTHAHIVITRQTIGHLSEVVKFAADLGMESVRLLHLVKVGSAVSHWNQIGVDVNDQIQEIIRVLSEWQTQSRIRVSLSGFPQLLPCRPVDGALGCQRGSGVIYISYDGLVFPCACAKADDSEVLGVIDSIETVISNLGKYDSIRCFNDCLNHTHH